MWTLTALGLIIFLLVINMILLMGFNDTPQHNAMDVYNHEREPSIEERISSNNQLQEEINDLYKQINDLDNRLTYHIQSTNELKPKA